MKKNNIYRFGIYALGMTIIALGLTLNTKAGMGVSAIISVPYCISIIFDLNFGDMTFVMYGLFVVVQIVLHMQRKNQFPNIRQLILFDFLQFPLSLVFTRFLNIFSDFIPEYHRIYAGNYSVLSLVLFFAIVFTGVGAAMVLAMHLVPNPGDGIVQAVSEMINKSVGFTKNCVDLTCVCLTLLIGYIFTGSFIGIGIGTLIAVVGVGRVIAAFNALFLCQLNKLCELEKQ